ncbi:MAG: helix-turn-helix transcriptional regulator [Bordetella sp.]|uniref:AraC family transcriptional regulator n=1 Tax=Bordetella sp. TaxID=28081 RepID=UPI003F7BB25D
MTEVMRGSAGKVEHCRFTTAGLAPADQWRTYCDQLTVVTVPVSRSARLAGFRATIDRYGAGDAMYIEARTDAYTQNRSIAQISVDKMQAYCFHVLVDGCAETSTGAYPRRAAHQSRPGILALDMSQPMTMSRCASQVRALFLPRAVVESVLPQAQALHGRLLEFDPPSPGDPTLASAVTDALTRLRHLGAMNAADARQSLADCGQLITAAFARRYRLAGNVETAEKAASFAQARRYIEAHLYDPDLTPDSVLRACGLARATLYRLFQHEGGLHAYIRNGRLRAAANELLRFPDKPIIEIAYSCGFGSAPDFARAFRRAYDMTPRDFRLAAQNWPRSRAV